MVLNLSLRQRWLFYAILQVDQAPAHTSSAIRWQEFIIPLFQPPSAPELNPIFGNNLDY